MKILFGQIPEIFGHFCKNFGQLCQNFGQKLKNFGHLSKMEDKSSYRPLVHQRSDQNSPKSDPNPQPKTLGS
ncbi:hypothetical protein FZC75_19255 [Sutcliffiella horikoshii]|uniref:Uncharacterized protein n=1 Tax=Sutcliffiella horikoshii TaxID=79883 RepID=A0A5D4SYD0_9BACI|nr:hypothetical protein FZC75_19255 [Sutcliffiella horikoshii]